MMIKLRPRTRASVLMTPSGLQPSPVQVVLYDGSLILPLLHRARIKILTFAVKFQERCVCFLIFFFCYKMQINGIWGTHFSPLTL